MTQYSIEQVQENPDGVIQAVEREKAVEITQHGKQVAVLLSVEEYDRLSQQRLGFAQSLELFRRKYNVEEADIDPDEIFKDVRDRSPGREVSFED